MKPAFSFYSPKCIVEPKSAKKNKFKNLLTIGVKDVSSNGKLQLEGTLCVDTKTIWPECNWHIFNV